MYLILYHSIERRKPCASSQPVTMTVICVAISFDNTICSQRKWYSLSANYDCYPTLAVYRTTLRGSFARRSFHYPPMPCGPDSYDPDTQCCCEQTVHTVPLKDCQCCGNKAYRRNEAKPDTCTAPCGTSTYHYGMQSTQLCCDNTVVNLSTDNRIARHQICCGQRVMNTNTHDCCNGFPIKKAEYGCCNTTTPYHLDTMKCYMSTGTVHMKSRNKFSSQKFCDRNLPEWNTDMPLPSAQNTSMIHVRGLPQDCSIRNKSTPQGGQIEMELNPFVVMNQDLHEDCAASDTLLLVIKLEANQTCSSEAELKASLHGVALDIFTRKEIVCSKASEDMPVLRLKDGKRAVIYMSRHANSILAKSLQ